MEICDITLAQIGICKIVGYPILAIIALLILIPAFIWWSDLDKNRKIGWGILIFLGISFMVALISEYLGY